jgi:HD-GYP domain-containing protein (c-di-GMP phosphodiesterase class II)
MAPSRGSTSERAGAHLPRTRHPPVSPQTLSVRPDDVRFEQLVELTDDGHGTRVANLAVTLAALRGWTPVDQGRLHRAARLHDVGKAALPVELLDRPGPLSPTETEQVRCHASLGAALAAPVLDAEQQGWILHHHERYDGLGYPSGCAGPGIPEGAQLLALADVWDAMTTDRPYRTALPQADALAEIRAGSGTQFRPDGAALVAAAWAPWR